MVQGLGFLSKKSWHTKNLANQEKVWIAEEREKDEKAKTAELAKQIQQEREEEELSRIAGRKKLDRGIDWMYTGHHKDSEVAQEDAAKEAEEYLLGKKFAAPATKTMGDLDAAVDGSEGVNAVVAAVDRGSCSAVHRHHGEDEGGATIPYTEDSVAQRNEAFRMRHEDPMFMVSLQAVRQEKSREQRLDLYERAGVSVRTVPRRSSTPPPDDSEKQPHHLDKPRHTEERSSRVNSHYHKSSSDDESDGRRRRHRKHRREKKHRRDRRRHRASNDSDSDSGSYIDYRTSKKFKHERKHGRDHGRKSDRRKRSPSEDSRDSVHSSRVVRRNDCKRPRRSDQDDHYVPQTSTESNRYRDPRQDIEPLPSKADMDIYGLQGKSSGSPIVHGSNTKDSDLGPDRELLRRKEAERRGERQKLRDLSQRRPLSATEREQARRAMQRDADALQTGRQAGPQTVDDPNGTPHSKTDAGATFLNDIAKVAHGVISSTNGGTDSMSKRIQQNQLRNQRNHDDSFL
jgi:N-terminal domain of CBF1 interacting co-repressor CIR/Pre-mRNA splicing factor